MFTNRAVNLMEIQFNHVKTRLLEEKDKIINLVELNKERQQMHEAEKVELYVEEEVYLATKCAMGNDFRHISV